MDVTREVGEDFLTTIVYAHDLSVKLNDILKLDLEVCKQMTREYFEQREEIRTELDSFVENLGILYTTIDEFDEVCRSKFEKECGDIEETKKRLEKLFYQCRYYSNRGIAIKFKSEEG